MDYVIMIGQLILSLSILIVLHEMGHFFPARWFGTRVEKFYLFFDPYFSLFKFKRGDTEYGIGWLPLGGYVKIAGMIDESMDREQMKQPPQPWEFRSKKAWQRLVIMLGGVTVNFILGFFLWGMVLFTWGEQYLPAANATYGIHVDSLGMKMGLQAGDKVLAIAGKPFDKFNDGIIKQEIIFNNANTMTIERNGVKQDLKIDENFIHELTSYGNKDARLFLPRMPFKISEVSDDSPAKKAGLQKEDLIISVDGQPAQFYDQFLDLTRNKGSQTIQLGIQRNNENMLVPITLTEEAKVGAYRHSIAAFFDVAKEDYSFFPAMAEGTRKGWAFLGNQIKAFGQMFRGKIKASESLGGFGSIGKMFGDTWEWERFWKMTAILSLILAFMNLLPIPALDGGHVMFLLYEVVSGRKPSDKFMEYATIIGFVLVLGLVVWANGMDVVRWWRG